MKNIQLPDYSLQVRRDGKNIVQLGILNFENEILFAADSLEQLKKQAGNPVVSFAGGASAPLESFTEETLR